jgi:hypothetical protein
MKDNHTWVYVNEVVKRCKVCNAYKMLHYEGPGSYYDEDKHYYAIDYINCDNEILKQVLK